MPRRGLRRIPLLRWVARAAHHLRQRVLFAMEYKPDRHVLEQVIFPALKGSPEIRAVLFVGCDWYTRGYPAQFPDHEFWTIDVDPAKRRYGASRHVVDSLENLGDHFAAASLDAIVCTGVFGWGIDGEDETERALAQCFECLRPGGLLVLGWAEVERWRPRHLQGAPTMTRFRPKAMSPFPAPRYPTFSDLQTVFGFYERPRLSP